MFRIVVDSYCSPLLTVVVLIYFYFTGIYGKDRRLSVDLVTIKSAR